MCGYSLLAFLNIVSRHNTFVLAYCNFAPISIQILNQFHSFSLTILSSSRLCATKSYNATYISFLLAGAGGGAFLPSRGLFDIISRDKTFRPTNFNFSPIIIQNFYQLHFFSFPHRYFFASFCCKVIHRYIHLFCSS